jgi:tetratricopeptide (TPR) repeat protein
MNDWDGAISAYRELLEGFPGHPESGTWSLRLGFAYLEAGQAGRALETFVGIDPGADDELGAELQFWIGECYFKMDRYERAAEEYLRVGFLYPHQVQWAATAEYNAGVSYEKMGRAEEARTIYRKLIRTRGTGDQWGRMAEERLRQLGE